MHIKLKNIGIVKDSTIKLDGLTIVTGKNNSGKTTVGKSLYSLLDAVSNLSNKAKADRNYYINEQIEHVYEALRFFRFTRPHLHEKFEFVLKDYPAFLCLVQRDFRRERDAEEYARSLLAELESFDVSFIDSINPDVIDRYFYPHMSPKEGKLSPKDLLNEQIKKAIDILKCVIDDINKDPELINYARESINQTLGLEFSSQIQPINGCEGQSEIELTEDDSVSFRVTIDDNKVINNGVPVYFGSQYKRVFLVDDPFILDGSASYYRPRYSYSIESEYESLLNPNRIQSHANRLKTTLHKPTQQTVLEQTLASESITRVKERMDQVLPGTFDFSSTGDYYVQNGKKLSVANLATGSKMFSIIKLLIEKGELDNTTILILDEPEAHLHPMWQNRFAEIIVLLVKELEVNILLTTHSPNFMLALDAYMRKYEIQEKTNFYQTISIENGLVEYSCVNNDISSIYADFLQYLSDVKVLRDRYLMNGDDEE